MVAFLRVAVHLKMVFHSKLSMFNQLYLKAALHEFPVMILVMARHRHILSVLHRSQFKFHQFPHRFLLAVKQNLKVVALHAKEAANVHSKAAPKMHSMVMDLTLHMARANPQSTFLIPIRTMT